MVSSMFVNWWGRGPPPTKGKTCEFEGLCSDGGLTFIACVGTWTTTPYEFVGFSFDRGLHSGEIIKKICPHTPQNRMNAWGFVEVVVGTTKNE